MPSNYKANPWLFGLPAPPMRSIELEGHKMYANRPLTTWVYLVLRPDESDVGRCYDSDHAEDQYDGRTLPGFEPGSDEEWELDADKDKDDDSDRVSIPDDDFDQGIYSSCLTSSIAYPPEMISPIHRPRVVRRLITLPIVNVLPRLVGQNIMTRILAEFRENGRRLGLRLLAMTIGGLDLVPPCCMDLAIGTTEPMRAILMIREVIGSAQKKARPRILLSPDPTGIGHQPAPFLRFANLHPLLYPTAQSKRESLRLLRRRRRSESPNETIRSNQSLLDRISESSSQTPTSNSTLLDRLSEPTLNALVSYDAQTASRNLGLHALAVPSSPSLSLMFPTPTAPQVPVLRTINEEGRSRFLVIWNLPVYHCWQNVVTWISGVLTLVSSAKLERVARTNEGGGIEIACDFVSPPLYCSVTGSQPPSWFPESKTFSNGITAMTPLTEKEVIRQPSRALAERLGLQLESTEIWTHRRSRRGKRKKQDPADGGAL
ncbi:hypothetical protein CPC08DRAFT_725720 [Agrocybe pediades]|nr:hypothetical protein CPC08DRAFT_725720 [Agrocybe pediades]